MQGKLQCVGTVADADTVFDTAVTGKGALELTHLGAEDVPAAVGYGGQAGAQRRQERRVVAPQVVDGDENAHTVAAVERPP